MHTEMKYRFLIHYTLSFIGGYLGLYAIVSRADLFGNAQTANLLGVVRDLIGRDFSDMLLRIGALLIYVTAVILTVWIPEHFSSDWVPDLECNKDRPDDQFKPYGATPGHGIEWARLITQWALSTYKEDKAGAAPYIEAAENLYNRAVADAWNADGAPGICYTTDWNGKPVVHDRMHWTLAEAINTSSVLFHVTDNEKYAADYAEFMKYLDEKVLDHVNGSWFHQLDEKNHLKGTVWPGKSDLYHALQSTLIPYHKADMSIAPAVKKKLEI